MKLGNNDKKNISAMLYKHLLTIYPNLTSTSVCKIASTFYVEALRRKNEDKTDKTPLTLKKETK